MSMITRMRKQRAIYWAAGALDHYARPSWADPIEIDVRWEEKQDTLRTPQGTTVKFDTVVYVGIDMKEGDRLKLGAMESNTVADPTTDPDTHLVQRFQKEPDFRNQEFLRRVYL